MGIDEGNVINHPTSWILEPKYNQLGLVNIAEFYATYYISEQKIRPGCLADMAREIHTLTNFPSVFSNAVFFIFETTEKANNCIILVTRPKTKCNRIQVVKEKWWISINLNSVQNVGWKTETEN